MERFIQEQDYSLLIKNEIKSLLVDSYEDTKLMIAELTAIDQIKNHLSIDYDIDKIFCGETRNHFIIMNVIDIALYHLYTSQAPDRMPEHRSQRYEDALKWLRGAKKGEYAYLPKKENQNVNMRVKSHKRNNHKW
ncbi:MAG: DUF1320 domain-containing protein [Marinifilaceae bacterium]|jgi:phage gp36-like protein|nr:DUF1320 domain-containing protein [Marinifilaceae bacterium]